MKVNKIPEDLLVLDSTNLSANSVTTTQIANSNVTNSKLNNGSSGDIPLVTVSIDNPSGGKNGDIWVKVIVP
jgi:hypothetical protein